MASSATSTPTTPAMPTTTTEEGPRRCGTVAMPSPVTDQAWRPERVRRSHAARSAAATAADHQGSITMRTTNAAAMRRLRRAQPNFRMSMPLASRERIDDAQFHAPASGQRPDDGSDEDHERNPLQPGAGVDGRHRELRTQLRADPAHRNAGEQNADGAAEGEQQHRFRQHQGEDAAVGEADGLEDGELRDALTHGLCHGVAGEENEREEHRAHDRAHDEA